MKFGAIELLEPIRTKVVSKGVEELLKKVENNAFIVVKRIIGSGQEFSMRIISERTNRQCISIDLDYIEELENVNLSEILSGFHNDNLSGVMSEFGLDNNKPKDFIFVIKRNIAVADDLEKIQEIKKIFEQTIFNKLNAVVFYMILEKHMFEYSRRYIDEITKVQKLMNLYKLRKKSKKFKNKSARF